MRVGIDARMFGPKQGGLGRYIEQLILNLEKIETNDKFVIFLRQANWDEYTPANTRFKKVLADVPWYGWQEQFKLTKIIADEKVDLMHWPHWNVPLFYKKPFVVTIHDLILLHYPSRRASTHGILTYWLKNLAFRFILRHAALNAKYILTPSEFSKQDIVKSLLIPAEKIFVTPLAPFPQSEIRNPKSETNSNYQNPKHLLIKYGITKYYVLYVGVAYPHKNLEGLINAWKIFIKKYGDKYQLVLAGKKNYFYERLLNNLTIEQLNNSIIFTGFVPDSELGTLYENAMLCVLPSFYEGFGLPGLEAMTYGIPVLSSNAGSLPEVLGDAAEYFDPRDENALVDSIWRCLTDLPLRAKLIRNKFAVLNKYSWQKCARQTWEVYKKVV